MPSIFNHCKRYLGADLGDLNETGKSNAQTLLKTAEEKRLQFGRSVQALSKAKIRYFDRAPELPQRLLDNCRLIQNRLEMVKLLPSNGVIAEIGTDQGAFARHMLESCTPKSLHIFELDTSRIVRSNLAEGMANGIISIYEGDSAANMSVMPDAYFDWIYIDGDHSYEGVKRDIEASAAKVKPGGFLVFNDYTTWSPASMSRCGVARAVNEFCIANEWEFVFYAFQSMMYNDVVIRQKV